MPALVQQARAAINNKRTLQDAPPSRNNLQSPTKKRKVDVSPGKAKRYGTNGTKSSQPKSQFEEEVLEKLTQDINGLKQQNAEKDQQWTRPSLDSFNENNDNITFQSIEAEEGTLHGGKATVKLFGVTEVRSLQHCQAALQ